MFERFGAQWTPTVQMLDADGTKRHQIEGFLPVDEFLEQLKLGLAHTAFAEHEFKAAENYFEDVVNSLPKSDAAAEALYWLGVARYKDSGDPEFLHQTAEVFKTRYKDSSWAKKASVWA